MWPDRIKRQWPALVAVVFALYVAALLVNTFQSQKQLTASAEAGLKAGVRQSAELLSDHLDFQRHFASDLAESHEVATYLANRDLGMSMQYGLNVSLEAVLAKFRKRMGDKAAAGVPYSRILLVDESGQPLVDTAEGLPTPNPPEAGALGSGLAMDVARGELVATAPVRHRGSSGGSIVTVAGLNALLRYLTMSSEGLGVTQFLFFDPGALGDRQTWRAAPADLVDAIRKMPADRVVEIESARIPRVDALAKSAELALRTPIAESKLSLLTLLPESAIHGQLVSPGVLVLAGVVPLVLLLVAWSADRAQRRTRQLEADVIVSTRNRAELEDRNVALREEIARREALEAQLRDSEERYRTAFRASPDAVNLNRLDDGTYLDVNDGFLRITGWSREDVIGRKSLDLGVWARPEEREELVRRLERDGRCENLEVRFRRKDGSVGVGMMSAHLTDTDGARTVLSITRDISDQIEVRHALLEAQRIAGLGSYRFNMQTGEWTDSPVMAEIFGIARDYPRTLEGWTALIHGDDREAMLRYVREDVFAAGQPFDREYRIVRPCDGAVRWMHGLGQVSHDGAGRPLMLSGTIQDVTARRAIEEALRVSEERLRVAQAAAEVGVWDVDVRRGEAYWSQETEALYGLGPGGFGQRFDAWLDFVLPAEVERVRAEIQTFLRAHEVFEIEYPIRHATGEVRWLLARGRTFFDTDGRPVRALGINLDTTERKRASDELDRYRSRLEELVAERTAELAQARDAAEAANRAKSAFLANMSHEIRTPMNGILGMAELVRREGVSPRQAGRLEKLDTAARHLLQVIDDILDLSKIEAGKLPLDTMPIDLAQLIEDAVQLIRDRATAKGLALEVDNRIPSRTVEGDPLRIKQALLNYLTNAVKFSERGTVRLRASMLDETSDHVRYRFEVSDEGVGIDAAAIPRLFSSFEQADNSTTRKYGGTGLGLAITRRLAQLMNGDAGASSIVGRGSTFWFTFRLSKSVDMANPQGQFGAPTIEFDFAGRSALIADDDPFNCEVTRMLLEELGMSVDIARDGIEAVERFAAAPTDIVLMDVQMPRLDGLDATRRIRASAAGATVPIIGVSANVFTEDRAACFAAGMNDFVGKPVLPEVLEQALARWLAPNPQPRGDSRQ